MQIVEHNKINLQECSQVCGSRLIELHLKDRWWLMVGFYIEFVVIHVLGVLIQVDLIWQNCKVIFHVQLHYYDCRKR